MSVIIIAWIGYNALAPRSWRFDPYTFTFLTLLLSLQASYAAPLILLAQNRQSDRDRLSTEEDRRRASLQKADTEYLTRELASLRMALNEVATRDFLRSELSRLAEELDEAAGRRRRVERKEERKEQHKAAKRADRKTAAELNEPLDLDADGGAPDGGHDGGAHGDGTQDVGDQDVSPQDVNGHDRDGQDHAGADDEEKSVTDEYSHGRR
jgi:uncharacterized membrane protein